MLSQSASNALLKTLEEPPDHVVFVLATTDPQKVLPTIRSRTQHYEFHLLDAEVLASLLADVAKDAKLELPDTRRRGRRTPGTRLGARRPLRPRPGRGVRSRRGRQPFPPRAARLPGRARHAPTPCRRSRGPRLGPRRAADRRRAARRAPRPVPGRDGARAGATGMSTPQATPPARRNADLPRPLARRAAPRAGPQRARDGGARDGHGRDARRARRPDHPRGGDRPPHPPGGRRRPGALLERIERLERRVQELAGARWSARRRSPRTPVAPCAAAFRRSGAGRACAWRSTWCRGLRRLPPPRPLRWRGTSPTGPVPPSQPALGAFPRATLARDRRGRCLSSAAGGRAERFDAPATGSPTGVPPESALPPPTRDELVEAWGDHVLNQLRPRVRAVFAVGRFLASEGATAILALPNSAHVERARADCDEVAECARPVFRPCRCELRLVAETDVGAHLATRSGGASAAGGLAGSPARRAHHRPRLVPGQRVTEVPR